MKNTGIEDISIDNSSRNQKKSARSIIVVLLIMLLIVLVALIIVNKYFPKKEVSSKQLFIEGLSNVNIIDDNDFYKALYNRALSNNSIITNNISYSSNRNLESFKEFDLNKFTFNSTITTDVEDLKFYIDFILNYSGNEFLKFNVLSDNDKVGIKSDQIVNKYVGLSYNKLQDLYNLPNPFNYIKNAEKTDLTKDEKISILKKYLNQMISQIPEEKFSIKDNIILEGSYGNIAVKEYKLELNQDELKDVLTSVLTELRNDEDLLKKITISPKALNVQVRTNSAEKNIIDEPDEIQNVEENIEENVENNIDDNIENNIDDNIENNIDDNNQENISLVESIMPAESNIDFEEIRNSEEVQLDELLPLINYNANANINSFFNLLMDQKIDCNVNDIKDEIDDIINKCEKIEGKGLIAKLYVSEEGTEKIILTLPNSADLEIEFHNKAYNESSIKITYLYIGDNSNFNFSDDETKEYSLTNSIGVEGEDLPTEDKKNGFSVEINKNSGETQNSINILYSFIEGEKINKKISIMVNTTGNINSKTIKNDIVISSSGEEKDELIIDNSMEFNDNDIDEFSENNAVFLDDLSEEDEKDVLKAISYQLKKLKEDKKNEVDLIDTNNQKYLINRNSDNISSNVTYEEAKNVLIETISNMMGEAQSRNEEFTIQNLVDLTIEGYNVSTTVTEESAKIVVDIYTFNIDSNFALTDAN